MPWELGADRAEAILASGAVCAAGVAAALGIAVVRLRRRLSRAQTAAASDHFRCQDALQNLARARKRARELAVMAKSAKALRNEFLSNISHEVRTPMNAIMGMTELALSTDLTPKQRHYLERAREASGSLLGLLNDLLDLAKIHTHRLRLNPISFRLEECLSDVVAKFRPRAGQKGLRFEFRLAPGLPEVLLGDPGRLRQVVGALLSNAVKFTEKGGVSLDLEVREQDGGEVCFHGIVTDTGIGIPPEKRDLIFEAFRQGDASETRTHGGCGLGLAIASELVHMMGGRIWFESEPGKGSRFHFTVRFQRQESQATQSAECDFSRLRGRRALVVHGDKPVRQALERMLGALQVQTAPAASAEAALQTLDDVRRAERPFELVIVEDALAPRGGFPLAQRLLADRAHGEAPIIMITAAGKRGDAARCQRLGIRAYLTLPIDGQELAEALVAALECSGLEGRKAPLITRHWLRERRRRGQPMAPRVAVGPTTGA